MDWEYHFYTYGNCTERLFSYVYSQWLWPALWSIFALICITTTSGLILNSFAMIVLKRASEDSCMGMVLTNVAICDQGVLLMDLIDAFAHAFAPLSSLSMTSRYAIIYGHPILWAVHSGFLTIRSWSMTYLSVTRAFCIAMPFKFNEYFSSGRTLAMLVVLWIGALALNFFKYGEVSVVLSYCPEGARLHVTGAQYVPGTYTLFTSLILNSTVPIAITILANLVLLYSVVRSSKFREQSASGGNATAAQKRSIRVVMLLSGLFILCQIPMVSYGVLIGHLTVPAISIFMNMVGLLINNLDSSSNFFIYIKANQKFKEEFKKLFKSK